MKRDNFRFLARVVRATLVMGFVYGQPSMLIAGEADYSFSRLFSTPEERAMLEGVRHLADQPVGRVSSVESKPNIVSFKGVFRARNEGNAVFFVEDPRDTAIGPNAAGLQKNIDRNLITLKDDEGKSLAVLKPGQAYSLESKTHRDYFETFDELAGVKTHTESQVGNLAATELEESF